jgi:20S proteasome alpha/beta subunit
MGLAGDTAHWELAMTLLVALRGQDGIVVATDSRGTFGDPRGVTAQNDAQKKLYVASKYSAILTAGSGELGAAVMSEILQAVKDKEGVTTIMDQARTLLRTKYGDWFAKFAIQPLPNPLSPLRPDLALILAGYDTDPAGRPTEQRIFQLISQTDFAPMLHNYGFALAGVAQYALYLLNRLYEKDSTVEKLKALAAYVITETASQDGKVGGPVQMATITPDSGSKELTSDEIDAVLKHNERRSKVLRDSFFGEK